MAVSSRFHADSTWGEGPAPVVAGRPLPSLSPPGVCHGNRGVEEGSIWHGGARSPGRQAGGLLGSPMTASAQGLCVRPRGQTRSASWRKRSGMEPTPAPAGSSSTDLVARLSLADWSRGLGVWLKTPALKNQVLGRARGSTAGLGGSSALWERFGHGHRSPFDPGQLQESTNRAQMPSAPESSPQHLSDLSGATSAGSRREEAAVPRLGPQVLGCLHFPTYRHFPGSTLLTGGPVL